MEENKKDVLPLEGEPLTAPQISEPVVNALAAALSKIETYVPTQYINDGSPDIDADHLNHAEQAIMRVTNLANGAADAIAALQSQLAQLNSDLKVSYIPYIPVFSWSDGGANPTVQNMDVAYVVFSKICFVYARYNITDLGKSDRSKSFLSISLPKEIEPIAYNAAIISSYYQISNEYTPLGVRIENKIIYIVNGIGGDHSGPHIKTGYQGFSVFFMCK